MFSKLRRTVRAHKIVSLVVLLLVAGGGYYWYTSAQSTVTVTKYVVEDATTGTVISSVTGSGQVQAVTSIDIKPQVTETVNRVYVKVGDRVAAGQLLVQLDTVNEGKSVQQAQLSLQSAQLSLAKLQQVATTTLLSDQNAVTMGEESLSSASTTLAKDYQGGFDALSSAFVDFQTTMAGLQGFVTGNDINKSQNDPDAYVSLMPSYLQVGTVPYRDAIVSNYSAAAAAYTGNLADYHAANRNADPAALDALFSETYHTAQAISDAVKAVKGLLDYVTNNYPKNAGLAQLPAITTTFQTNFGNYASTASGDVSNIAGVMNTVANDKNSLNNAQLSLNEASTTLAALVAGPNPLDVQSQQISIQNAQIALQNAEQNLSYCSLKAPIGGIVSAVPAIVGVTVPSPAVSMVTQGKLAQVTLNEVDAAKVALGDKATLAFDALPDLSLAGQVSEIDAVGTVSQGVVNYNVQVAFEEASGTTSQVRPGMSVTANIVTAAHQDVIAVPNAAVTTQGGASYVLEPASPVASSVIATSATGGVQLAATKRVPVTIGLTNDTLTEITSGVNVGDQIIVQTIKTSASTASTASTGGTSALRLGGGLLGGGGPSGR